MTIAAQPLLTQDQAAELLGLSNPKTLAAWRLRRKGPRYVKLGACVRYKPADIAAFINAGLVDPLSAK